MSGRVEDRRYRERVEWSGVWWREGGCTERGGRRGAGNRWWMGKTRMIDLKKCIVSDEIHGNVIYCMTYIINNDTIVSQVTWIPTLILSGIILSWV